MERQLLLLGLLLGEKMYGYQLNEFIERHLGFYTDIKKPTAYYTLEKLQKEGYVQRQAEREGKRPERHIYQITDKGRNHFLKLLRTNLSSFSPTYHGDDIGITFMDQISTAEARQLLAEKREKAQAALQQVRELPGHGANLRYVIGHIMAHLDAEVAWLNSVLSELDDVEA